MAPAAAVAAATDGEGPAAGVRLTAQDHMTYPSSSSPQHSHSHSLPASSTSTQQLSLLAPEPASPPFPSPPPPSPPPTKQYVLPPFLSGYSPAQVKLLCLAEVRAPSSYRSRCCTVTLVCLLLHCHAAAGPDGAVVLL